MTKVYRIFIFTRGTLIDWPQPYHMCVCVARGGGGLGGESGCAEINHQEYFLYLRDN